MKKIIITKLEYVQKPEFMICDSRIVHTGNVQELPLCRSFLISFKLVLVAFVSHIRWL